MNLGRRYAVALQMAGVNPPAVSKTTGIPVATINALIRRDSSRSNYVEQLLGALPSNKVNVNWVRTGQGTPEPINLHIDPQKVAMEPARALLTPQLARDAESSAMDSLESPLRSWEHDKALPPGTSVFLPRLLATHDSDEKVIKVVFLISNLNVFQTDWIREALLSPSGLCWVVASDDSMEPVLWKGDACVVDTKDRDVHDGNTYVIMYASRPRIRKLFLLPDGGLRLKPINDKYEVFDVHDPATVVVIGRVIRKSGAGGL